MCFTNFTKGCRIRVFILIYYIGKGYFLTGQSENGYQFQNVEHTVKGKFCGPLFTHRYKVDQQAPSPLPPWELSAHKCILATYTSCYTY